jgi:hypothetical protein
MVTAFCNHALVTKKGMVSPVEFTPKFQEFWTAHPRDRVFGSRTNVFSTQFTGFCICYLMYDDKHMLKVVQHATASALNNQEATTTFLLLPDWMENSTNTFHKTYPDNKDICTILENIPRTKVRHMPLLYQGCKTPLLSEATWGIHILLVWNKAAREPTNNPTRKIKQVAYHQRQSEILKRQAPYLFLNRQLKGYCQEWQKYVGSPNTKETQLLMQKLAT